QPKASSRSTNPASNQTNHNKTATTSQQQQNKHDTLSSSQTTQPNHNQAPPINGTESKSLNEQREPATQGGVTR
ncbi:hypothetical protein, partial [Corynebacterium canis]|uniref:hypothetical protein n=1 Tax=Corynebacterium canis TaxID=679663 RepID=UPI001C952602